jgi:hypothetical protein
MQRNPIVVNSHDGTTDGERAAKACVESGVPIDVQLASVLTITVYII